MQLYAAAWGSGDIAAACVRCAEDFTLHYPGQNALTGAHVGKHDALDAYREFARRSRRKPLRIVDVLTGSERGVLIVREAVGPDAIEVERTLVFAVSGGLFIECWVHESDQDQIDTLVGLA